MNSTSYIAICVAACTAAMAETNYDLGQQVHGLKNKLNRFGSTVKSMSATNDDGNKQRAELELELAISNAILSARNLAGGIILDDEVLSLYPKQVRTRLAAIGYRNALKEFNRIRSTYESSDSQKDEYFLRQVLEAVGKEAKYLDGKYDNVIYKIDQYAKLSGLIN